MNFLITGVAGFIGSHLAVKLLSTGHSVFGIDLITDYYDIRLKKDRVKQLETWDKFTFELGNVGNRYDIDPIFYQQEFDVVIHLAAQVGVRYSLKHPYSYIDSNLIGFFSVLELAKQYKVKHFIYASSSSVYGMNQEIPFSTDHNVDHPISLYAATKKSNELIAHSYSHLYGLPCTGLRFFTVYGPFGRPDMAYFKFTKAIYENKPIDVYNHGNMKRDFTYIDDIVEAIVRLIDKIPKGNKDWQGNPKPSSSPAPYKIYNIGNNTPVKLLNFIEVLENKIGKKAKKNFLDMQPGDMAETFADVDDLQEIVGFKPKTTIEDGIGKFVEWYKSYYR